MARRHRWPTAASPSGRCCCNESVSSTRGRRVDAELLAAAVVDGATLSTPALARLQQLVGLTLQQLPVQRSGSCPHRRCLAVHAVADSGTRHGRAPRPRARSASAICSSVSRPPMADDPQATGRATCRRPSSAPAPVDVRRAARRRVPADPASRGRARPVVHAAPRLPPPRRQRHGAVVQVRHDPRRSPAAHPHGRAFTRQEYVLAALVLAATVAGPAVISLRDLVDDVRSAAAEADVTITDDATGRRALVNVLRWMIELGLATELHAHVEAYASDGSADAVIKLRPDRIALVPLPAAIGVEDASSLLAAAERRTATRQWLRGRLVEDPVRLPRRPHRRRVGRAAPAPRRGGAAAQRDVRAPPRVACRGRRGDRPGRPPRRQGVPRRRDRRPLRAARARARRRGDSAV